jgi:tetrahydromethanopterin S-methyltransferase subunit F
MVNRGSPGYHGLINDAFKIFAKRQDFRGRNQRCWCGANDARFAEVAIGITSA